MKLRQPDYNIQQGEERFRSVNTCKECRGCASRTNCAPAKQTLSKSYLGIRFTADGYDCALPVSMDSHNSCAYACLYCFAENLGSHKDKHLCSNIRQYSLNHLVNILSGNSQSRFSNAIRMALKRDSDRPCAVQVGALTDPFDNIERQQGWALALSKILRKYNQPARFSTKGTLLLDKKYLDAFSQPDLFWFAFSIITPDDDLITKIDRCAPNATERLKVMKALSSRGVSVSLRFRPMIPNVSDRTKKHPFAYRELIERSAEAGAKAVSIEALFAPNVLLGQAKQRWDDLEKIINFDLRRVYKTITTKCGSCIRPERSYVEDLFHACQEVTKKCGMVYGVSDPTMKHLNDSGCCCGILETDPVFGNYQKENATQALVDARDKNKIICGADYIPEWAHKIRIIEMVQVPAGPMSSLATKNTWATKLIDGWNDLTTNRGTLQYFQGTLKPIGKQGNNILWQYHKPQRTKNRKPIFNISG